MSARYGRRSAGLGPHVIVLLLGRGVDHGAHAGAVRVCHIRRAGCIERLPAGFICGWCDEQVLVHDRLRRGPAFRTMRARYGRHAHHAR